MLLLLLLLLLLPSAVASVACSPHASLKRSKRRWGPLRGPQGDLGGFRRYDGFQQLGFVLLLLLLLQELLLLLLLLRMAARRPLSLICFR